GAATLGEASASRDRKIVAASGAWIMLGLETVRVPNKSSMLSARRRVMSVTERIGPLGLAVGQRARRTQTVTAKDVELYAQITGDRNPLHFDADFAKRTRFGGLVAQGGVEAGMRTRIVTMVTPGGGTV